MEAQCSDGWKITTGRVGLNGDTRYRKMGGISTKCTVPAVCTGAIKFTSSVSQFASRVLRRKSQDFDSPMGDAFYSIASSNLGLHLKDRDDSTMSTFSEPMSDEQCTDV